MCESQWTPSAEGKSSSNFLFPPLKGNDLQNASPAFTKRRVDLAGMSKEGFWDMPTKAGVACLCTLTCSVCTEEAVALKSGSCSFASRLLPF